jgi:hypothetical protein
MKLNLDSFSETAPAFTRYILAVVLALIAVGLRLAILPISSGAKFTTFYPAVIMAFFLGGNGPGILAIAITLISADYLLLSSFGSFKLTDESIRQSALYLVAVGSCGYFVNRMHTYRKEVVLTKERYFLERLDEADQSLSLAVDGARLGVWRFLPVPQNFAFSDRFAQQFGFPLGVNVVSRAKVVSIIHPDDREAIHQAFLDQFRIRLSSTLNIV